MKFFSCILSIYILVLIGMPCVDVHAHQGGMNAEISQSMPDHHHQEFDRCSPFCTCDCCTSPVVSNGFNIYFEYSPVSHHYSTPYTSSYISSLFITIWHPPKIS